VSPPKLVGRFRVNLHPEDEGASQRSSGSCNSDGSRGRSPAKSMSDMLKDPTGLLPHLVHSIFFEFVSWTNIILSATFLGMETEYMATHDGAEHPWQQWAHLYFNVFFVAEFGLRIGADGWRFLCNKDWRWNLLDALLAFSSLVDLLLSQLRFGLSVTSRPLALLRLLRLLRSLRVFRTLRGSREFHKMLYGILSSMRTLMCALMILFFVVYFFAIFVCQGVTEHRLANVGTVHSNLEGMYGSLPMALYTLFAAVSQGYDWTDILEPLRDMSVAYTFGLVFYIALVLFGVTNVVTSVFVESAIMSAKYFKNLLVQERQQTKEVAVMHMREVFQQIDRDGSGEISADEMEYFLTEPGLRSYVDALGISAENTRMLFRLMDVDDSGRIDLEEFCEGCLRLQGEARSIDVHTMIFHVRTFLTKWSDFTEFCEERFTALSAQLSDELGHAPVPTVSQHRNHASQHRQLRRSLTAASRQSRASNDSCIGSLGRASNDSCSV